MNASAYEELNRTTEHDDLIEQAMWKAIDYDEGAVNCDAKALRDELRKRGLCIASDVPVGWRVTGKDGTVAVTNSKAFAVSMCENKGYRMAPVFSEVE